MAGLRLGMPKKLAVLSLDTPGCHLNFQNRDEFSNFVSHGPCSRLQPIREKSGLVLDGLLLPAFGIPSRNPAIANEPAEPGRL